MKTAPKTVKILRTARRIGSPRVGWVSDQRLCRELLQGVRYFWANRPRVHKPQNQFST